ncbi:MAG: YCF48-related protein [Bacteroidota bacterium]
MKKLLLLFTFIIFSSTAVFAQGSFTSIPGITGGQMGEVQITESGNLYVVSRREGNVYTSNDNGENWETLNTPNDTRALFPEGNDLYSVSYSDMFKSTDEGESWERIIMGNRFENPDALYRLPNTDSTFVIHSACNGIYVSNNNGADWVNIAKNNIEGCDGRYTPAFSSSGDIYFWEKDLGILKHEFPEDGIWSADKSEVVFEKQITDFDYALSIGISETDNVFITYTKSDNDGIEFAKSESGELNSFNPIEGPTANQGRTLWEKSNNGNLHIISDNERSLWELTDENQISWSQKTYPGNDFNSQNRIEHITWTNNSEIFATGSEEIGVLYSNDNGGSWEIRNGESPNAIEAGLTYDIEILGNGNIIAKNSGGQGSYGLWISTDDGESFEWSPQDFTIGSNGVAIGTELLKLQDNSVLINTSEGIQRSTDGVNWQVQNTERYGIMAKSTNDELYAINNSTNPAEMMVSSDKAEIWTATEISGGFPNNINMTYLFLYNDFLYAGITNFDENNKEELWRIDINNAVATKLQPPNDGHRGAFELNGNIYLSDGRTVAISSNQGNNWTTLEYPHQYIIPINQRSGGLGLSSRGTLTITQDDGETFRNVGLENPNSIITDVSQDISGTFYASAEVGSAFKFDGNLVLEESELPPTVDFTWQQKGSPLGGNVKQLTLSPENQLFATNSEVLFSYNNSNNKWDRVNIPNHIYDYSDMIIDDSNVIYFLDTYQLLKSSDNGNSWDLKQNFENAKKIRKAQNGNIVISTSRNIIYAESFDADFSVASGLPDADFNQLEITDSGVLWASTNDNEASSLFKSSDNGVSWTEVNSLDLSSEVIHSINKLPEGALAVVTSADIYKSEDDGNNWTSIKSNISETSIDSFHSYLSKIYSDPEGNFYFYNQSILFFSEDEGNSWEELNEDFHLHDDNSGIRAITWYNSEMLIGTGNEGILSSSDGGSTFNTFQDNNGFYGKAYENIFINDGNKFIIPHNGKLFKSSDDGDSFTEIDDKNFTDKIIRSYDGNLISYGGGISKSEDGGDSWTNLEVDLDGHIIGLSKDDSEDEKYFAATDGAGVLKFWESDDLNEWTELNIDGLPNDYGVWEFGFAADASGNIYFTIQDNGPKLYKASFGTANLISQNNGSPRIRKHEGQVYLKDGNKISVTSDGDNYSEFSTPEGREFYITENGYLILTNEVNSEAWISLNNGDSWQQIPGLTGDKFKDIEIDPLNGYAYAIAENQPLLKSSDILIPNDNTAPILSNFTPENNESSVDLELTITLNFNETVNPVEGEKIRLFEKENPNTPVETFNTVDGTFSNENTMVSFEPSVEIEYLTDYFIIIDNGAFTDIFGNPYEGINSEDTWTFTTLEEPDLENPSLSFDSPIINKGEENTFELSVTDNRAIDVDKTTIYYRNISSPQNSSFNSSDMTAQSTEPSTEITFTASVSENWYDDMGLEYYFEAEDEAGNRVRLPSESSEYFYSYINFSNEKPGLEGIPFGSSETDYKMISVPHKLVDSQIATQFDELGAHDPNSYRIMTFDNGQENEEEYQEFPDDLTNLGRGIGYWILLRNFKDIFLENASSPENNRNELFELDLKKGWNQIGNPYTTPISWEEIRAEDQNVIGAIKMYSNGNYSNGDILEAYQAGFVYAESNITVPIYFEGGNENARLLKKEKSTNLNSNYWELPINIKQGEFENEIGGIGMAIDAKEGKDIYDDYNPPSISNAVELHIKSLSDKTLAKSVVQKQEEFTWEFNAIADGKDVVELSWENQNLGENTKELMLFHINKQKIVDMKTTNNYSFSPDENNQFKIYYGDDLTEKVKPDESVFNNAYPNPASNAINFPFTISEEDGNSKISVVLFNHRGQKIQEIFNDNYDPGFYSYNWAFENLNLSKGIYFCKSFMQNENGNTISNTQKIIIK